MASRWDRLLESKPVPLLEQLIEEVAKLVVKDLASWPLPFTELDPAAARQFEAVLEPDRPRPFEAVFAEALRLARWELEREMAAYDEYMRNRRYLERGLAPADRAALLFISRWLVEQLLALGESTGGRVNRKAMLACLTRITALLPAAAQLRSPRG